MNKKQLTIFLVTLFVIISLPFYVYGQTLQHEIVILKQENSNLIEKNSDLNKKNEVLQAEYITLEDNYSRLYEEHLTCPQWISLGIFKITCYWLGEDMYGEMTSSGVHATPNNTIAVDPNIIPLGTKVFIDGEIYTAQDVGGAVKGNVIDIWVADESLSFGRKFSEVFILKR